MGLLDDLDGGPTTGQKSAFEKPSERLKIEIQAAIFISSFLQFCRKERLKNDIFGFQ
jgi:hypothetical protein